MRRPWSASPAPARSAPSPTRRTRRSSTSVAPGRPIARADRARALGLPENPPLGDVVREYIEDYVDMQSREA